MVEYLDDEGTWKEAEVAVDQVFKNEYEAKKLAINNFVVESYYANISCKEFENW